MMNTRSLSFINYHHNVRCANRKCLQINKWINRKQKTSEQITKVVRTQSRSTQMCGDWTCATEPCILHVKMWTILNILYWNLQWMGMCRGSILIRGNKHALETLLKSKLKRSFHCDVHAHCARARILHAIINVPVSVRDCAYKIIT